MKVILVMVSTLNGKITRREDPNIYSWTSKEDSQLFSSLIKKHNLIVMGSKTYVSAKERIKLTSGKLRVIITRNPQKYISESKAGMLEFSNEAPIKLIERLAKKGYKKMLLVGGGEINALFLKVGLVDELYLTVEPIIFGTGKLLVAEGNFDAKLQLISIKKLNKKGTIALKYKILRT